jgi:hypothetical protein
MAPFGRKGLRALAGMIRQCTDRFRPWIQDSLVAAARVRWIVQELQAFRQRVAPDLIRRWRGATGF